MSTASLIVGVAAAQTSKTGILVAGVAGLVAGAMSMAAGEYVSVSSQADTEAADLARERAELDADPDAETRELAAIYRSRGVDAHVSLEVARQLMVHDALGAHARDELGLSEHTAARPIQAALTSAATFSVGAVLPLAMVVVAPGSLLVALVSGSALVGLALLGGIGARVGGAGIAKAIVRVTFWGAFAMGLTAGIGHLFGTVI